MAEIRGRELAYLRELQPGESLFTELAGFGPTARDYDIRIENSQARSGVRIEGDRPLEKLVFWSIRKTLCPEPYVALRVEPGQQERWSLRYTFYELDARKGAE
jgi:hypothetical protein